MSIILIILSQPAFTCSKLTIEIQEQGVKYVQINNKRHQNDANGVSLLLTWIYFTPYSSVSIVNFEHVNDSWVLANGLFLYPLQISESQKFCNVIRGI